MPRCAAPLAEPAARVTYLPALLAPIATPRPSLTLPREPLIDDSYVLIAQQLNVAPSALNTSANDLAIQGAMDEILEYHKSHMPKNTRTYEPKWREWRVSPLFCSTAL